MLTLCSASHAASTKRSCTVASTETQSKECHMEASHSKRSQDNIKDIVAHACIAQTACLSRMQDLPYPPAYQNKQTTDAALVLEGGAMRALFTNGVLDVFLERGLLCKEIVGVSAGALLGYNYVAGAVGRSCFINLRYCDDWRYLSMRSFILTGNAFGRNFVFDTLPNKLELFNYHAFDTSPMHLTVATSNLETGEANYHRIVDSAEDIPYLIASSSMPLVSEIVELDNKQLLDGGTCDSVPISYATTAFPTCKRVIICTNHADYIRRPNKLMALMHQRYTNFPFYLERAAARHYDYNRCYRTLKRMHADGEAFVIWPPEPVGVSNIEHDRDKLFTLYKQGVETAMRVWPALEHYLAS